MKIFNATSIKFLSLLLIQSLTTMVSAKTEEQKYRIVLSDKEFEIRLYPSATLKHC
jgi:hypothetical protein